MQILYNAKIRSLRKELPAAEALAIRDGRILALGSNDQITNLASSARECEDMRGKTLWPGLTDAHIHLQNYAASLQLVDCETGTREECLHRVAARAGTTQPGDWILGHGWNQNLWPEGFGNAAQLDRLAPDNPVFLTAKSLHACWVNSRALQLAGINRESIDPPQGLIHRDVDGNPSGILFEAAIALVQNLIPEQTVAEVAEGIRAAQERLWSFGLTGVHDFDRSLCFAALQQLHRERQLNLRVLKSIPMDGLDEACYLGLATGFGDDFLRIGPVKCFADGALGPQTAAMLQPYQDNPDGLGLLFLDADRVFEIGRKAVNSGLSLAIHAIGDRANQEVLQGYRRLRAYEKRQNLPHLRHRIEHVQILAPDDLNALAGSGIIASVQPIHATSDMLMADRFWGQRARNAYAYHSLHASGARLAFGSDAPVESPNPFWGIHAAVTRRRRDGSPSEDGWYPQERLGLAEALQAFTTGPAYAAGQEQFQGQLEAGYAADLIALEDDPFDLPPQDLYTVHPIKTMVAGEWVWEGGNNG